MIKILLFAIAAVAVYALLRKSAPEYSVFAECFAVCAVLLYVLPELLRLLDTAQSFFDAAMVEREYFIVLLKVTGLAILTQFSSDLCRDHGQNALAAQTEFAGKVFMIAASLPLLRALLEMASVFFSAEG